MIKNLIGSLSRGFLYEIRVLVATKLRIVYKFILSLSFTVVTGYEAGQLLNYCLRLRRTSWTETSFTCWSLQNFSRFLAIKDPTEDIFSSPLLLHDNIFFKKKYVKCRLYSPTVIKMGLF